MNLLKLRLKHEITQFELTVYLDMDQKTYHNIENGLTIRTRIDIYVKLAFLYDVSIDYLLGRESDDDELQISQQLRAIVGKLMTLKNEAVEEDNSSEIQENMEMLRCLLQQSEVLAKRVEKEKDNSWYKY